MSRAETGHRYYPLTELLERDRDEFPEGQTLAVKKAVMQKVFQDAEGLRLKVLDALPEEYILDEHTLSTTGITAATVRCAVEQTMDARVTRRVKDVPTSWSVEAIRFVGYVLMPDEDDFQAVGAFVPGEIATGYLHILDTARIDELFPSHQK